MKNLIFISPKNYHFNGKVSKTQSDIFYHFKESLMEINKNLIVAKFKKNKKEYLELDLNYLKKKINKKSIIFIDGNISTEENKIYPLELYDILKKSKSKIVCFVPDLIKELKFKNWVNISNVIIGFTKDAVDWANKHYKTKKFHFYPSIPVKIYKRSNLSKFCKRKYDVGYVGSNKYFRTKFLNNLKLKESKKFKILILNSNRKLKNYRYTKSYLKLISQCKFYFCTRASLFEKYYDGFFNSNISEGRFAGRVSEAIACGSIPLYWQPKFSKSLYHQVEKRIFFSKKKLIPSNWGMNGNIYSVPYDNMSKNLAQGIEIVKNVEDAFNKITLHDNSYINNKLKYGSKIYKSYISPKSFYNFVKKKIK